MKIRTAKRTALGLAISMVMTYPVASQALGLGELHSSSQLNQPLSAQIDLLSTSAQEARQLQVKLASPDVFSRVGIDRPAFLDSLTFTPSVQNGKPVIRVTSSAPISEPFLNFLLEVSWPQGQLLKEYTVLLDPPVLMNAGSASTENAVAVRAEPTSSGVVKRGQEAERQKAQQQRQRQIEVQRQQAQAQQRQQQEQQRQQQVQAARESASQRQFEAQAQAMMTDTASAPASSGSSKYRVKRGDTMGRIASRLRYRGVSNNQMMLALFRANPQAFSQDNINNLKTGAVLTKPAKSAVTGSSSAESKQIIRQHYTQWMKHRSGRAANTVAQQPSSQGASSPSTVTPKANEASSGSKANLTVAGSDADNNRLSNNVSAAGTAKLQQQLTLAQEALASSKSETAELHSRVGKLEAIIRKKDRLITLKNERLALLEAQYTGANNAEVDVDQPADIATEVGNQNEQSSGRIIRGEEVDPLITQPELADPQEQQAEINSALGNSALDNSANTHDTDNTVAANTDAETTADVNNDEGISSPFVDGNEKEKKGGILELLSSPLVAAIGGGGLLALLLGWFLMRRSSSAIEVEDDALALNGNDDFLDEEPVSSLEDDLDDFTHESKELSDVETLFSENEAEAKDSDAIDSILSSNESFDEDEVLQEVDVYIVYGLHEQAEDELKKAIAKNPAKMEYRYKLLENYKAADDAESFVSSAKDFLKAEGDNKEALWDKVVLWGKEIAPENGLFSESSLKSAMSLAAGGAGVGAAAMVTKEAFSSSSDDLTDNLTVDEPLAVDDFSDDLNISDLGDNEFDLSNELDLDDDFGLDALADDEGSIVDDLDDNVLDFGTPVTSSDDDKDDKDDKDDITGLDLNLDQMDVDKILPKGNGYTSDDHDEGSGDNLDDALSFLDISDDNEEVQQAHIGTKLDLARAYLDMGDVEGARHTLEEVVIEGNDDQKKEAEELLQQTG